MKKIQLDRNRPIYFAQGRQTTQECLARYPKLRDSQIIACDIPTQFYLMEEGLASIRPQELLPEEDYVLRDTEALAHRWSETWYFSLIQDSQDLCLESYATRDFFACFLVLLRGYQLLEAINKQCPSAKLFIPFRKPNYSLRFQEEDSPFPFLLSSLASRYPALEIEWIEALRRAPNKKPNIFFNSLKAIYQSWNLKSSDIVLLGNSKLLNPVAEELARQYTYSYRKMPLPALLKPSKIAFPLEAILSQIQKSEVFQFEDVDFFPVVLPLLRNFYRNIYPSLKTFTAEIHKILKKISPRLLLCDEDVTLFSKALVDQANRSGIHTLVISHGYPGLRQGFVPLTAEAIAVWGSYGQQRLTEWGIDNERIEITGCPKYDKLSREDSWDAASKKAFCKKWGWEEALPIVVITPNDIKANGLELFTDQFWIPEDVYTALDIFINVAKDEPRLQFLYKIRQGKWNSEIIHSFERKYSGIPKNFKIIQEGLATDYMKISDAVFCGWSSAALEAVLLKKPMILMQFLSYPEIHPYSQYGFTTFVRSREDVMTVCRWITERTLPGEMMIMNQENLVVPLNRSRDGRAALRIAEFIERRFLSPSSKPVVEISHAKD